MATLDPAKNFAIANVLTGYAAGVTTIVLQSGLGALFPDPSTDGAFNLVYWNSTDYANPSDDTSHEIIRVTARSTDTLTVTRAQESTSDVAHNTVGKQYKVALAWTKKMRDDVETYVNKQWKYVETITFTSSSAEQISATFGSPTTAQMYKVVFTCSGGTNIRMRVNNHASGASYDFSNIDQNVYPSFGGTTGNSSFSLISTSGGSSVGTGVGEVIILANGTVLPAAANISCIQQRFNAVMVMGQATLSGGATSISSISFLGDSSFSGIFKIYRLDI